MIAALQDQKTKLEATAQTQIAELGTASKLLADAQRTGIPSDIFAAQQQYDAALASVTATKSQISTVDAQIESQAATQPYTSPASEAASSAKIASAGVIGNVTTYEDGSSLQIFDDGSTLSIDTAGKAKATPATDFPGGIPRSVAPPSVSVKSLRPARTNDQRVRIIVPDEYLKRTTIGLNSELSPTVGIGGIVFPYTPSISFESKADFAEQKLIHSNYNVYFYQRSYVTPITISGKFTVQNDKDAGVYLATVHLLRALTKMQFGTDQNAGSPPPVCRLKAYGEYMFDNVPISISSFKIDLPENIDYYTLGNYSTNPIYGKTTVPIMSTISITCVPMYSRAEMQKFSVNGWLTGNLRKLGYL